MRLFGARIFIDDRRPDGQPVFEVSAGRGYAGREYTVEGDASAASYFFAAAAVTQGSVRVEGVGKESLQGDARCADVIAAMGCRVKKGHDAITVTGGLLRGVDWDCADIPDVVPTLAVVAAFARGRTRLRGVAHLRHKESDRILSVATELRKLGVHVKEMPDGLEIEGTLGADPTPLHGATIDSWGDHRIVMAFSVAALAVPDMVIREPHVVEKSFPGFFGALEALGARVEFLGVAPSRAPGIAKGHGIEGSVEGGSGEAEEP
jgi:3-phosphoshikimate 1-carboxyvinyltransferase